MLKNLIKKKKVLNEFFLEKKLIGRPLKIVYRFKGVYFLMSGNCIYNRKNSIAVMSKKKEYFVVFTILKKNIYFISKLDTFFFDNKFWKIFYRKSRELWKKK